MRYTAVQVTLQEVPDEISLSLLISGCPLRCPGCHSSDSWNKDKGILLDRAQLAFLLKPYKEFLTCICFMGGEWHLKELIDLCHFVREEGLKVALYTGLEDIPPEIKILLNYLKTGSYKSDLGGLGTATTNQKLIKINAHGGRDGKTQRHSETG